MEVVRPGNGLSIVALAGELDLSTIPRVEACLLGELRASDGVVVDLTRLDFIDSSGIALLINAHRAADGRAALHAVVGQGSQVEGVFALAEIERALPVFLDRDQAIGAIETGGTTSGD